MRRVMRVIVATGFGIVLFLLAGAGLLRWNQAALAHEVHDGRSGNVTEMARVGVGTAGAATDVAQQARAARNQTQVLQVLALSFLVFVAFALIVAMSQPEPGLPKPLRAWMVPGEAPHAGTLGVGAVWGVRT